MTGSDEPDRLRGAAGERPPAAAPRHHPRPASCSAGSRARRCATACSCCSSARTRAKLVGPDGGRVRLRVCGWSRSRRPSAGRSRARRRRRTRSTLGLMDPAYAAQEPDAYWADIDALKPKSLRIDVHWDADRADAAARSSATRATPPTSGATSTTSCAHAAEHGYTGCQLHRHGLADAALGLDDPAARTTTRNMPNVEQFRNFVVRRGRCATPAPTTPTASARWRRCRRWTAGRSGTSRTSTAPCARRSAGGELAVGDQLREAAQRRLHGAQPHRGRLRRRPAVVIGGALYRQRSPKGIGPIALHGGHAGARARSSTCSRSTRTTASRDLGIRDGERRGHGLAEHRDRQLRPLPGRGQPPLAAASASRSGSRSSAGRRRRACRTSTPSPRPSRRRSCASPSSVFRREYPRVAALIWFLIKDEPTRSPRTAARTPGSPASAASTARKKPAYAAWQRLAGAAAAPLRSGTVGQH